MVLHSAPQRVSVAKKHERDEQQNQSNAHSVQNPQRRFTPAHGDALREIQRGRAERLRC
jgi:hypothetical protein